MNNRQLELMKEFKWYSPHGGADLRGVNLGEADLSGAKLRGADMSGADLRGADLSGADLGGANLGGADLRGAKLRGAKLIGADLREIDLRMADLSGANLDFSAFPLWCGSLNFKDETGEILRQLAYHLASLKVANGVELLPGEAEFANGWSGRGRHVLKKI